MGLFDKKDKRSHLLFHSHSKDDHDDTSVSSHHRSIFKDREKPISSNNLSLSLSSMMRRNHISGDGSNFNSTSSTPVHLSITPLSLNLAHSIIAGVGEKLKATKEKEKEKEKDKKEKKKHGLKRFFKILGSSRSNATNDSKNSTGQAHHRDEFEKYTRSNTIIGTGASGLVSLATSKTDPSKVFAIKKFRARLPSELDLDYKTKVINEFKIGEILHHENLVITYELLKEMQHRKLVLEYEYYIVMEYCPYDFFNLVMSGLMSQQESYCYIKQIINGTLHLHQHGLAHRDLKLDNCVVTKDGVLKLIDFGLAFQFRHYESETLSNWELLTAVGIVGSDPYLAPEVFEYAEKGYDVRLADVWLIAIIFCCMQMKRFPWKIPKDTDVSYKAFAEVEEKQKEAPTKEYHEEKVERSIGLDTDNLAKFSKEELVTDESRLKPEPESKTDSKESKSASEKKKKRARGAERLLRSLPKELHEMIRLMLKIDPKGRIFLEDIPELDFYKSIESCHVVDDKIVRAANHEHHLVTEEELTKIQEEKARAREEKEKEIHS